MSKSNISVLAKSIASKRGLTQAEAERFISKMFEVANEGLQEDKLLKMKWLGTFKVTPIKDRESVDVNTGERIVIEGRDKITFTPDNILKEIVNKPFAQFETVVVNDGVDFSDIDEKFSHQQEETEEVPMAEEMPLSDVDAVKNKLSADDTHEQPSDESIIKSVPSDEAIGKSEPSNEIINKSEPSAEEDVKDEASVETPSIEENKIHDTNGETSMESECLAVVDSHSVVIENPEAESSLVANDEHQIENDSDAKTAVVPDEPIDSEEDVHSHHLMIPKYWVAIVSIVFVALLGGMGWFAFNYGKMQAQRDLLALQLKNARKPVTQKVNVSSTKKTEDTTAIALKKKAIEDSIRMVASSKAVEMAEKVKQPEKAEQVEQAKVSASADSKTNSASAYDTDPRVRTGAYRIVGVAQTVVVKDGQSLASLSNLYLGPGMECYMEALNGTTQVKVGQKVKIPKLELKRKKK